MVLSGARTEDQALTECLLKRAGSKSGGNYEPLLLENEREAVADLLQYLESKQSSVRSSLVPRVLPGGALNPHQN